MIITPKTTLEEIKNTFPNHHWGINKVNGALNAIKASEKYNVEISENDKGELIIEVDNA